jgi:thioredoxin reductase (NADPH)
MPGRPAQGQIVILAGGARSKQLPAAGADIFAGKGIIHCALCEGGQFTDRIVAVCGGGDAGVTEALYLAKGRGRNVVVPHGMPTACVER